MLAFAIPVAILSACTSTAVIQPYLPSEKTLTEGVVLSLPKTILQVDVVYSLYEKKTWQADGQGKPIKVNSNNMPIAPKSIVNIVLVDSPIKLITRNVPDQELRFVFNPATLNGFLKDTDLTLDFTPDGLLKSTNAIVKDKSKEVVSNFATAAINTAKAAAVAGTDVVELTKIKDFPVTRLVDINKLKFTQQKSGIYLAYYLDDKSDDFFGTITKPEVKVVFSSDTDISKFLTIKSDTIKAAEAIGGIPYRVGGQLKVSIEVDDIEIYDNYHNFTQVSGVSVLPLKSKAFSDSTNAFVFSEDGATLTKIVTKTTSQGEGFSSSLKDTTNTVATGIKDIDQTSLDKLKKEKEILDAELALAEAKKKLATFK